MTQRYAGGCLCGAVRYVADGDPVNARVCHCRLCQRAIGAAFNARLLFRVEDVAREGTAATFASSATLKRGFCRRCGTTLFSLRERDGVIGLTAGSLDDPSLFKPTDQIWTSSRQPWLTLDEGLACHAEGMPP